MIVGFRVKTVIKDCAKPTDLKKQHNPGNLKKMRLRKFVAGGHICGIWPSSMWNIAQ
jgi:hypothetical protein